MKRSRFLASILVFCMSAAMAIGFAGCSLGILIDENATDGLAYYPLPDGTYAVAQGNTIYLEEIIIPSTYKGKAVTLVAENGFKESKAKSINIPASVTGVGCAAFSHCESLKSVVIPDSVIAIGDYAFGDCSGLTSLEIPDSVIAIGNYAFLGCSNLTSIEISNNVTTIGYGAFDHCSSLTSIEIPDGVTSIGDGLFYGCSMTSIEIPDSVKSIGNDAFSWCSSLTSMVIPDGLTSIGDKAFYGCSSLTIVYYQGAENEWAEIEIGSDNYRLTDATCYYYSENEPTTLGNYWHYVDGVLTEW